MERVLTTGFLDGTHPIVDTYELKVWTRGTWCGPYSHALGFRVVTCRAVHHACTPPLTPLLFPSLLKTVQAAFHAVCLEPGLQSRLHGCSIPVLPHNVQLFCTLEPGMPTSPVTLLSLTQVRLDHMLRRLRVLEESAAARAPAKVRGGGWG